MKEAISKRASFAPPENLVQLWNHRTFAPARAGGEHSLGAVATRFLSIPKLVSLPTADTACWLQALQKSTCTHFCRTRREKMSGCHRGWMQIASKVFFLGVLWGCSWEGLALCQWAQWGRSILGVGGLWSVRGWSRTTKQREGEFAVPPVAGTTFSNIRIQILWHRQPAYLPYPCTDISPFLLARVL